MSCALAILAGGKGERLGGIAKGLLRRGGRTLIEAQLELAPLFDEVLLVANDPAPYRELGVRTVPDAIANRGAPGGVHAALAHASSDWVFVLACDMPFVTGAIVQRFLSARTPEVEVVAAELRGQLEPLPSVWRRSIAPMLGEKLEGSPSLRSLCESFALRRLSEGELARVDPDLRLAVSINRPEDLAVHGIDWAGARKA